MTPCASCDAGRNSVLACNTIARRVADGCACSNAGSARHGECRACFAHRSNCAMKCSFAAPRHAARAILACNAAASVADEVGASQCTVLAIGTEIGAHRSATRRAKPVTHRAWHIGQCAYGAANHR